MPDERTPETLKEHRAEIDRLLAKYHPLCERVEKVCKEMANCESLNYAVVSKWIAMLAEGDVKPILDYIRPAKREGEPATHDYTKRGWGHDFTFDPGRGGLEAKMTGWGFGIQPGDYLILPHSKGGTTRYKIQRIQYYQDPPDMWRADVTFSQRDKP